MLFSPETDMIKTPKIVRIKEREGEHVSDCPKSKIKQDS